MRPHGAEYGGQTLTRGALYLILQNRLYRGEIAHKGDCYPGEHPAIVNKTLRDDVQAVLAANRVERANGAEGIPACYQAWFEALKSILVFCFPVSFCRELSCN
jgi:hypothetical protein